MDARSSVAAIARSQRGLITTRQLRAAGLSPSAIRRLVGCGWLVRVHRGVYLLGAVAMDFPTRALAAVLACGDGAVASHAAAAFIWRLIPEEPALVDVTVDWRQTRDRPGIRTHEAPIARRERRVRQGVPLTSPSLTLLDLAAAGPAAVVERALNEARVHRLTSQSELAETIARHPGHHGLATLLPIFRAQTNEDFSRKEAEQLLWRLIRTAGLPEPRRNVRLLGHELDFLWPELRLNVELDGYRWHSSWDRLNRDRERDAVLTAHGYRVLRFSYDQLRRPEALIARLAATIAIASTATA